MLLQLLLLPIFLASGSTLSKEENEKLQKMCGRSYIKPGKIQPPPFLFLFSAANFRAAMSMNTKSATRFEAPFTVLIHMSFEDGTPEHRLSVADSFCTGTIISPRHILTAAHCMASYRCLENDTIILTRSMQEDDKKLVYRSKLNYIFMSAPAKCQTTCDTTLEKLILKPKRAFIHKNWILNECGEKRGMRGDFTILELEEDIRFTHTVQPACVFTKKPRENTTVSIYGYGMIADGNFDSSGIMRKHSSQVISRKKCLDFKTSYNDSSSEEEEEEPSLNELMINGTLNLQKDEICTKGKISMSCAGDSGSGVIFRKEKRVYVTGVTSWGPACEPEKMKLPDDLVDVISGLFLYADWVCAVSGVCPEGSLTEEEKRHQEQGTHVVELDKDFSFEVIKETEIEGEQL